MYHAVKFGARYATSSESIRKPSGIIPPTYLTPRYSLSSISSLHELIKVESYSFHSPSLKEFYCPDNHPCIIPPHTLGNIYLGTKEDPSEYNGHHISRSLHSRQPASQNLSIKPQTPSLFIPLIQDDFPPFTHTNSQSWRIFQIVTLNLAIDR